MGNKLSGKDLIKLGFPKNNAINIALGQINRYRKREKKESILTEAKQVLLHPEKFKGDGTWGKVAEGLVNPVQVKFNQLKTTRAPFSIFGENEIDEQAKFQLYDALKLPISVKGALMPDAHSGYGLPIGGVLATENAVIPYGVGVDIGCRMSLSIFDLPASFFKGKDHQLQAILKDNTKFGMSETHQTKADHEVFYRDEFKNIPIVKQLLDKAYKQLGSSGGGNHFVEFGIVKLDNPLPEWKLEAKEYVAVLSHSGSRGLGANIAKHYTYLASKQCPLPKNVQHLAWLDLNTHDGQEYWLAMNLAGDYAKACHEDIHRRLAKALGKRIVVTIENHHNFAWKEIVDGKEKSLTGDKYYIPGSVLEMQVDNSAAINFGMGEKAHVLFNNSPVFKLAPEAGLKGVKPLAWFGTEPPLKSGWAWGQQYLKNGVAAFEAQVGKGKLYAFGPEITFRGQSHGTFKMLFNGLYK